MSETAADILINSIIDWGVDTVFGLPGEEPGGDSSGSGKCAACEQTVDCRSHGRSI